MSVAKTTEQWLNNDVIVTELNFVMFANNYYCFRLLFILMMDKMCAINKMRIQTMRDRGLGYKAITNADSEYFEYLL